MSVIRGTPTSWSWETTLAEGDLPSTVVLESDVDDTPVDGATTDPISSNWAFDHVAAADPHTVYQLESEKGANSGYCGLDAGGLVANADLQTTVVLEADVDDVAVDGATTDPISSNWAYDHLNIAGDPHSSATGIGGYSFGVLDGNIFVIPNMTDDYFLVGTATGLEQRVIADGDIPAAIARDTEVPGLASAQVVEALPAAAQGYEGIFKILNISTVWATDVPFGLNDLIVPTAGNANGHQYKCTTAGTSHATTEPTWPTGSGATVNDNDVVWTENGACNSKLYICVENDADTFEWIQIGIST